MLYPPAMDLARYARYVRLARLDKPQGALLVFWPFAWGLTLAAYRSGLDINSFLKFIIQFFVGSFLLRGAAVTFNDICDRDFDKHVERTKDRPIANGSISVASGFMFLSVQLTAIVMYFWSLNAIAYTSMMIGLILLSGIYPLMKRITYWPQAWLGVTANWGLIIAWSAILSDVDCKLILPLHLGMWAWTMMYDTVYACQDKRDDARVGIKSTAILFEGRTKQLLCLFGFVFIMMLAYSGYVNKQGLPYYFISVGGASVHLIWQLYLVDLLDSRSCWENFRKNSELGMIIWFGMLVDYLGKNVSFSL